ncbi:M20/M25/M40 family metallo-hydrolase [Nonomuraea typhae]|uniref:M20/M25/M40 family metallo-hydrolase n=1 Tax=Nonomuraea typhae TaxID=2603600 RepID=UPI0012FC8BF5|nr:M20/M25/M40 family metallo-hydrolase [Nonomuraea typhae]
MTKAFSRSRPLAAATRFGPALTGATRSDPGLTRAGRFGPVLTEVARWGPAVAVAAVAALSAAALRPPRPVGAGAPPGRFSARRARRHLDALAAEPRPAGSPAAARARDHVVGELRELGFEVDVQDAIGVNDLGPAPYGPRYLGAGRVRNIVARYPGTVPGPAVLLMTHYDSVAHGPGASDAGVPLAALLEAVRALLAGPAPRSDLLVVVTDGEEGGLLGGRAFFAEHPYADTAGVVLNFDARGTGGPVLMFETGPGNGPVAGHLARSSAPAFGSSTFVEVYRRLPNATDFTMSRERGLPGLNFANIEGFVHYHGPLDDLAHVDDATLQHHGELALDLARRLTSAPVTGLTGPDSVFFTLGRGRLVRYPAAAAGPLAALAAAVWATGLWRWSRRAGPYEVVKGLPALAGRLAAGAGGAAGLVQAVGRARPEFRLHGDFYDSGPVYGAVCGLSAATGCLPGSRGAARLAAATVPLAVANAAFAARLPGASYLATWPLLAGGAGLHLLASGSPGVRALGAAVAGIPAAGLLAPLSRLLFTGLTPRMGWTSALALGLLGELAAPAVERLPPWVRRAVAALAAGAAAAQAVRVALRGCGPERPRPETLGYLLDGDTGEALWLSTDPAPNGWTRRALGAWPRSGELARYFAGWRRRFLHAPAPRLPLPSPEADIVDVSRDGGVLRVTLCLRSPREASQIRLALPGGGVRRWAVEGRAPAGDRVVSSDPWELWLHAVPPKGLRVELEVTAGHGPVEIVVADRSHGLPSALTGRLLAAGPAPEGRVQAASLHVETWGNATWTTRRLTVAG